MSVNAPGPTNIPAYSGSNVNQTAIVDQITSTLAPFDVDIVTTRPTSGDYSMIVIGGEGPDLGLPQGTLAVSSFGGCDTVVPRRVSFAFDNTSGNPLPTYVIGSLAVGGYLLGLGLPTSDLAGDCLCWESPSCTFTAACTIGGANTPRYQQSLCGTGPDFDEAGLITAGLTCP